MQTFEWGPGAEWQAESAVGQMKQAQPSRAGRARHAWDRTAPGLKVSSQINQMGRTSDRTPALDQPAPAHSLKLTV